MNKFKLALFDNDGTLVTDERVLTDRTRKALIRLHEEGYLLGLASGRGYVDLKNYPEKWGLGFDFDVYISWNGAELYDGLTGQLYKFTYLQPETIHEIIEYAKPMGISPNIPCDDAMLVTEVTEFVSESMSRNRQSLVRIVKNEEELYSSPAPKILYRMSEEKMKEFEAFVAAHPTDKFIGYKTQPVVYEFASPQSEKSFGVRKFCEMHDISLDEVIAFGDTTNDNTMLACCHGVCMANGSQDTKDVAKEITRYTNNEDGLADYVETHLLNKE